VINVHASAMLSGSWLCVQMLLATKSGRKFLDEHVSLASLCVCAYRKEFAGAMYTLGMRLQQEEFDILFGENDLDNSGEVTPVDVQEQIEYFIKTIRLQSILKIQRNVFVATALLSRISPALFPLFPPPFQRFACADGASCYGRLICMNSRVWLRNI
jgi:hypothetical protein